MGKLIHFENYIDRGQSVQECHIQREIDFLISELDYCLRILKQTPSNPKRLDAIRWMQTFVKHCENTLIDLIDNPSR